MFGVGDPFRHDLGIGPLDISHKMGHIALREVPEGFTEIQFLREMEHRPEQVCETLVFQQNRILQKTDEKGMLLLEGIAYS